MLVEKTELPRLTSHGLRHTAATQMVAGATDIGQLRAIADILGHSVAASAKLANVTPSVRPSWSTPASASKVFTNS